MYFLDVIFPTFSTQVTTSDPSVLPGSPARASLDPILYFGPILVGVVIIAITFSIILIQRATKKKLDPAMNGANQL